MSKKKVIDIISMDFIEPTCSSCVHFKSMSHNGETYSECYRYPPSPLVIEGEFILVTVEVDSDRLACGEFKPKN
jgi:hypothetical protein